MYGTCTRCASRSRSHPTNDPKELVTPPSPALDADTTLVPRTMTTSPRVRAPATNQENRQLSPVEFALVVKHGLVVPVSAGQRAFLHGICKIQGDSSRPGHAPQPPPPLTPDCPLLVLSYAQKVGFGGLVLCLLVLAAGESAKG